MKVKKPVAKKKPTSLRSRAMTAPREVPIGASSGFDVPVNSPIIKK